jgi:hypothetical protein
MPSLTCRPLLGHLANKQRGAFHRSASVLSRELGSHLPLRSVEFADGNDVSAEAVDRRPGSSKLPVVRQSGLIQAKRIGKRLQLFEHINGAAEIAACEKLDHPGSVELCFSADHCPITNFGKVVFWIKYVDPSKGFGVCGGDVHKPPKARLGRVLAAGAAYPNGRSIKITLNNPSVSTNAYAGRGACFGFRAIAKTVLKITNVAIESNSVEIQEVTKHVFKGSGRKASRHGFCDNFLYGFKGGTLRAPPSTSPEPSSGGTKPSLSGWSACCILRCEPS